MSGITPHVLHWWTKPEYFQSVLVDLPRQKRFVFSATSFVAECELQVGGCAYPQHDCHVEKSIDLQEKSYPHTAPRYWIYPWLTRALVYRKILCRHLVTKPELQPSAKCMTMKTLTKPLPKVLYHAFNTIRRQDVVGGVYVIPHPSFSVRRIRENELHRVRQGLSAIKFILTFELAKASIFTVNTQVHHFSSCKQPLSSLFQIMHETV